MQQSSEWGKETAFLFEHIFTSLHVHLISARSLILKDTPNGEE